MKRTLILFLAMMTVAGFASAKDINLPTFSPVTPEVKGQGGTVVSQTSGYNTLFGNPAAFASKVGSFTILSANPTVNISLGALEDVLAEGFIKSVTDQISKNPPDINALDDLVGKVLKEGVGSQVNLGVLGLTTGGLGLGVAAQSTVLAKKGATILGTKVTADVIVGAVIGYAVPIDLGLANLQIGLDVRPMQRTYGEYSFANAADLIAGKIDAANGFGLGLDMGASADFGELVLGVAIRDIGGTTFTMKKYAAMDIANAAMFPSAGVDATDVYSTAMTITPALSYEPDFGLLGLLVQPKLTAELTLPLLSTAPMPSLLASSHIGAEVKLLSFLALRAGLNQGYATMGFGAHLLFLDANLAIYSDELGTLSGQNKKSGIAAEVAIRF